MSSNDEAACGCLIVMGIGVVLAGMFFGTPGVIIALLILILMAVL
jgi:hypothetical protein